MGTSSAVAMRKAFEEGKLRGLRTHQRNLFAYYLNHKEKFPGQPCFVPRPACHHTSVHLNAIDVLEKRGLVKVERNGEDYQQWQFCDPDM